MSNINQAVDAAIGLTTLAMRIMESVQSMQTMVLQAETEGRDLSDEDISNIQTMRRAAMTRLEQLLPPEQ